MTFSMLEITQRFVSFLLKTLTCPIFLETGTFILMTVRSMCEVTMVLNKWL